ncbi:energy transducer TonB [Labilibaculum sp. DW002]|uniref:Energy transducer TonB n=1 Tax=Paralabilibaculum antarcticum TaxID=2912572 RepID=A0ABT5VWG4_9BACT|nr:energy transducer TonB [Labilibaculum sp. DW002]MDE5419766.1 energy transducer TonB [Labilibaculum sp. DW002]
MKKTFLLLIFAFVILEGFSQAENSNSTNAKSLEDVLKKTLGNLIIQTIPSAVNIEIPQMGIKGNKTQDSLILEEIHTGKYDLIFRFKKKKFKCSVEVLDQKTIHVLVDVKKKKFSAKEINYKPHLPDPVPIDPNEVFVIVDDMPEFPGGQTELQKWIAMNVNYPLKAIQNGITGRVFTSCVINQEGKVENVKVIRSVNPDLDAEAVRVITSMPTWKPGRQNGQLAKVSYTFPINFQLSDPTPVKKDTSEVFVIVDEMPEFPGGSNECQKWIAMNVEYPERAMLNGVMGKVYISFVINKDGMVESVKVIRSVDPDLDSAAVKVISNMPIWKPGRHGGELAKVSFTFPISFYME